MYNEDIKGLLELNPNIASIWIDADGEWYTYPEPNTKEVKRDEILGETKKAKKKDE